LEGSLGPEPRRLQEKALESQSGTSSRRNYAKKRLEIREKLFEEYCQNTCS